MTTRRKDVDIPLVLTVAAVFFILIFVLVLLLEAYFNQAEAEEIDRKFGTAASEELTRSLAVQQSALAGYRWVDEQKQVVAIPIERAMDLIVEEAAAAEGK